MGSVQSTSSKNVLDQQLPKEGAVNDSHCRLARGQTLSDEWTVNGPSLIPPRHAHSRLGGGITYKRSTHVNNGWGGGGVNEKINLFKRRDLRSAGMEQKKKGLAKGFTQGGSQRENQKAFFPRNAAGDNRIASKRGRTGTRTPIDAQGKGAAERGKPQKGKTEATGWRPGCLHTRSKRPSSPSSN